MGLFNTSSEQISNQHSDTNNPKSVDKEKGYHHTNRNY